MSKTYKTITVLSDLGSPENEDLFASHFDEMSPEQIAAQIKELSGADLGQFVENHEMSHLPAREAGNPAVLDFDDMVESHEQDHVFGDDDYGLG